ncbi:uncharacterized protein SOCE836_057040 [Sorangium cellulosum]|uniref:Uncharacterized protein n=1 Tax=Sorangium cellulosum TaxID=56 RepID=A0A4P2QT87_SORCE|nr:uncharacterized protein SOCE836_057040 [Sorangium cellulosum]
MLALLKQARAFGVGVVLATQNPMDLDDKALPNAGAWFVGRSWPRRASACPGCAARSPGARSAASSAACPLPRPHPIRHTILSI